MATVTDQAPRARVAERLTRLRAADERLSSALDAVVAAVAQIPKQAIDREPVSAIETTVGALREPLPPDVAGVSAGEPETSGIVDQPPSETAAASEAIQTAFGAVSDAGAAATALFTTARLMYHGAVCTFADGRSQRYAATSKALHDLLPQVVAWELREAGMYCQCICPNVRAGGMRLHLGEPPCHRRRVEPPRTTWTGRARGRAPISAAAREPARGRRRVAMGLHHLGRR